MSEKYLDVCPSFSIGTAQPLPISRWHRKGVYTWYIDIDVELQHTFSIISSEGSQSPWEGASVLSALHPPTSWEFMPPTLCASVALSHSLQNSVRCLVLGDNGSALRYNYPLLRDMEAGYLWQSKYLGPNPKSLFNNHMRLAVIPASQSLSGLYL